MATPQEQRQTLMRIFIGESDRWQGQALKDALIDLFQKEGLAGATVLKGSAGFGAGSRLHTDKLLRLSYDLPVVIEVIDEESRLQQILPQLDTMMCGGLVTFEAVRARYYSSFTESKNA